MRPVVAENRLFSAKMSPERSVGFLTVVAHRLTRQPSRSRRAEPAPGPWAAFILPHQARKTRARTRQKSTNGGARTPPLVDNALFPSPQSPFPTPYSIYRRCSTHLSVFSGLPG